MNYPPPPTSAPNSGGGNSSVSGGGGSGSGSGIGYTEHQYSRRTQPTSTSASAYPLSDHGHSHGHGHSNTSHTSQAQNSSSSSPTVTQNQTQTHSEGSASSSSTSPITRIRRRNRMITSCLECRRRKLKCNKSQPCTNCVKFSRDCRFLAPALDQASQLKLTEIKEKVGSLERLLERDVAKTGGSARTALSQERALPDESEDDLPAHEDEENLEPSPWAISDAAYGDDGDDNDLLDLGIRLGKMRITERIGGFFRPKITQELERTMSVRLASSESSGGFTLSPHMSIEPLPPASEWLKPGAAYIAPGSSFLFGHGGQATSLMDSLPSRIAADRLIKQYFTAVHPITQILHRPTFEKEYQSFWNEVSMGIEPPGSVQTIVFAAMFSGVVSMDESTINREFGVSRSIIIDNFRRGTESALARANFLRTTKVEILQAFVMYLIPPCRAEISRAHSVLVGAAIRMAECMGLHRDGTTYGMNPLETHIRRLIWHQLCFLDIRTCEATGPKPQIRRDDFDTKLPLNINDDDLLASDPPPSNADRWTDATFCLIRFEVNEMMRQIWIDRPRLERRKISLTAVLAKIETFRANMAAKYDHLIDDRVPIQKCAKLLKMLLVSRLHVMVLHLYHLSAVSSMPGRLRQILTASGTTVLETAVALETLPDFAPWAWYAGAYQQFHIAFLLLMEVYVDPNVREADRLWACLDWIYECDLSENREVKAKKIMVELQRKTAVYQGMLRMRAPVITDTYLGLRPPIAVDVQELERGRDNEAQRAVSLDQRSAGAPLSFGTVRLGVSATAPKENLWVMPLHPSPEASSDSNSAVGQTPSFAGLGANTGGDDLMSDIDWDAFDVLFPPEQQNEEPTQPGFFFPPIPGVGLNSVSGYGR